MLDALLEPSLHPETDEASASPILSSLSRPRQAALCLAASRCGRRPLGAGEPPALRARRGRRRRRAAGVAGKKWLCISYPSSTRGIPTPLLHSALSGNCGSISGVRRRHRICVEVQKHPPGVWKSPGCGSETAQLTGSGAIAQGPGAVAAGQGGVAIGGSVHGNVSLGSGEERKSP